MSMQKKVKGSSRENIKDASNVGRKTFTRHFDDCKKKPDMCARLMANNDCDLGFKEDDVKKACKEGVYDQGVIETQTTPQDVKKKA